MAMVKFARGLRVVVVDAAHNPDTLNDRQKTACCNRGWPVAPFKQPACEGHTTLPNDYSTNSPGSVPVIMPQGRPGIPPNINLT